MDYYNNYYEELYHAGLFSALRGRIRDGHKWITRTGTPGHYVYTYAKKVGESAGRLFGKPRGMFGTGKTTSASKSTWKESGSSNSGTNDWHDSQRKDAEEGKLDDRFVDRTAKGLAKRDANTGRNVGKMTTSIGDSSPSYVNDSGERASRKHVNYTQYEDGDKKKVTRTDYNTRNTTYRNGVWADGMRVGQSSRTSFNTREYNLPIKKKSIADRIKEWGANTLSSIRKTANDAAGAVSKGYESAKNWVVRKLASASGKGNSAATGARIGVSHTPRNYRTSRTTYNEYFDARRKEAAVEFAKNHRNSAASARKGALAGLATASSAISSSSSSSNRPRRREKNVTNTQATAVSPKKGSGLGYDFTDKRRANPIKTDANNYLLPGNNPYARLGNSVRVPGAQRKKRRQSSGASRSR